MDAKSLKQIENLFESHTALLRKEIQDAKIELKKAIDDSQEDTIAALSTLMNEGHNNLEERIQTIEKELNITHPH